MISTRSYWISILERLARPILRNLASEQLRARMPIEAHPSRDTAQFAHLEAFARLLSGIAPWLELENDGSEESEKRADYAQLARAALKRAVDPASPDYLNFAQGQQPVVDIGFLAQAVLRAPRELWEKLDAPTQANLVAAIKSTRTRKPNFNNWLLFSAIAEAALCRMGQDWDKMRVDYALRQHEQWYLGDGIYGDGPRFHSDGYNAFVIGPMLVDIIEQVSEYGWKEFRDPILRRAQRFAAIQERSISPEGTFPVVGRSAAYRFGALQGLAQAALKHNLPPEVAPAQVRCALTSVMRRIVKYPGTFDEQGWLRIGFCGAQPGLGEPYINTGSLYLCATALLPLGLPLSDLFWSDEDAPWTARQIWSGIDVAADKALRD